MFKKRICHGVSRRQTLVAMALITLFLLLGNIQGSSANSPNFEMGYSVSTLVNGSKFGANFDDILPYYTEGDFLLLDNSHNRIWKLTSLLTESRNISLFSGCQAGYVDGDISEALYITPYSFTMDDDNNIYIADVGNYAIRKITNGIVTTIAGGTNGKPGYADGPGEDAQFSDDFTVTHWSGSLLIADRGNHVIRLMQLKSQNKEYTFRNILGIVAIIAIVICSILFCTCGVARRNSTEKAEEALIDRLHHPSVICKQGHKQLGSQQSAKSVLLQDLIDIFCNAYQATPYCRKPDRKEDLFDMSKENSETQPLISNSYVMEIKPRRPVGVNEVVESLFSDKKDVQMALNQEILRHEIEKALKRHLRALIEEQEVLEPTR